MSKFKKVGVVFSSVLALILAAILIIDPEEGYFLIVVLLATTLITMGIRNIWFYFTMARHMVGGQTSLYLGFILFDLGIVTVGLPNVPKIYVVIYLVVVHGLAGTFALLRVNEARKNGGTWVLSFIGAVINIAVALLCLIFLKNTLITVYIYSAGLVNTAVVEVIAAFRKTEIVYIQ